MNVCWSKPWMPSGSPTYWDSAVLCPLQPEKSRHMNFLPSIWIPACTIFNSCPQVNTLLSLAYWSTTEDTIELPACQDVCLSTYTQLHEVLFGSQKASGDRRAQDLRKSTQCTVLTDCPIPPEHAQIDFALECHSSYHIRPLWLRTKRWWVNHWMAKMQM